MRYALAVLGLAGCAAAQAVTSLISPTAPPPAGCTTTHTQPFELSIVSAAGKKRAEELAARQNAGGDLVMVLNNGVLKDNRDRQGYVASNYQFQFDGPPGPQAGAIYTAGFSICPNNTIALGGNAIWWSCSSGSSFDNLYDRKWAPYCNPVYFYAIPDAGASIPAGGSIPTSAATPASGASAASTPATTAATAATTPLSNSTMTASSNGTVTMSSMMTSSAAATTPASSASAGGAGSSTASHGAAATLASEFGQAILPWAMGVAGIAALL